MIAEQLRSMRADLITVESTWPPGTFMSAGALEEGVAENTRRRARYIRAAETHNTSAAAPPSVQARRRGTRSERAGLGTSGAVSIFALG